MNHLFPRTVRKSASGGVEIGHSLKGYLRVFGGGKIGILSRVVITQSFVKGSGKGSQVDVIKCAWWP